MDRQEIEKAAQVLIAARRTGTRIAALPQECRPATVDDAHAIQEATVAGLGDSVAGWKVAAPIDGKLVRGAILRSRVLDSPARLAAAEAPMLGVEAEIAFQFDRDMPPRADAYSRDEVAAAVTAFPAIEVVDSRFADYAGTPPLDRTADCVSNGAFVRGPLQRAWRERDLVRIEGALIVDGRDVVRRQGGHAAGDPLLPAIALVNDLRLGSGVRAGQVMTTGTYTGLNFVQPGQTVTVAFAGMGGAEIRFV